MHRAAPPSESCRPADPSARFESTPTHVTIDRGEQLLECRAAEVDAGPIRRSPQLGTIDYAVAVAVHIGEERKEVALLG